MCHKIWWGWALSSLSPHTDNYIVLLYNYNSRSQFIRCRNLRFPFRIKVTIILINFPIKNKFTWAVFDTMRWIHSGVCCILSYSFYYCYMYSIVECVLVYIILFRLAQKNIAQCIIRRWINIIHYLPTITLDPHLK